MENQILITLGLVLLGGILPPLIWLWFWLKEDKKRPEPKPLIIATFIGGMIAVPIALYFEKLTAEKWPVDGIMEMGFVALFFALAALVSIEEIAKYLAAQGIAFPNKHFDEPVDAIIYMITAALGFAALENSMFLINNLSAGQFLEFSGIILNSADLSDIIIGNNLRFIGANVVHVVASGVIGVFIGLSFYKNKLKKAGYFIVGILSAILLHTLFNFLIISFSEAPLIVFTFMWVAAVVLILLFEKVKRVKV